MSASAPATWVLVRGLTRERAHWGSFPSQLDAALGGARVIALDLPGAGVLHGQRSPTTVAAMVDSCRAQLAAMRVDGPVNLLGLSLGGMVVIEWLHRRPGEVGAAVIVNSSARGAGRLVQRLRPANWTALLRIVAGWGTRPAEHEILRLTSAWPQRHAGVLGAWVAVQRDRPVSRLDAWRQLVAAARYRLPAERPARQGLVVCGEADALVDPQCSRMLARRLGWDLAVHPEAGHDLPLDDGAWLAARLAHWIAGT